MPVRISTCARSVATACLVALAVAMSAQDALASRRSRPMSVNQQRAAAAYQAMQQAYYLPRSGLYRGADAWSYSQAMAATISVAALPHMHRGYRSDLVTRLSGLQAYADHTDPPPAGYDALVGPPHGPGGARFNDDNEWIGIELLRLYHLNHQRALLDAAGQLFAMVNAQWVSDPTAPCPGGVPWQDIHLNGDRNTVSNATAAELGAQLYITTGRADYLQAAETMYAWVRGCLMDPSSLYYDHINSGGQVDTTEWTYNQGTMIGAGVMLYKATGDATYLAQAQATGQSALMAFDPQQLALQPTAFDAIYIRNLLLLGAASGDGRYLRFAQWFANDEWSNVRDDASGLFLAGPVGTTHLLDQAAMVQVYALLAEPISAYF